MSENNLLVADTTKRYNIPLGHLDYGYIEKCHDFKELEKMLITLRSGEEGVFPDLEKFCEARLTEVNPKSRMLRKADPLLTPADLEKNEWEEIDRGIKDWSSDMKSRDDTFKTSKIVHQKGEEFDDSTLPPIRSGVISVNGTAVNGIANQTTEKSKQKRVKPREYREWDKFNVEKELEKVDENDEKKKQEMSQVSSHVPDIDRHINSSGMSEDEKLSKAAREKDKGNEAFRAGDYEEAILYYSRSISLAETAACINNRALAYLKQKKWDKALFDCRVVLDMEPDNIKALLRRGSAYKGRKEFTKAKKDFERALELEPVNKRAEELLQELKDAEDEIEAEKKKRKEKGRRMVIEEVDGDEEEEKENTKSNDVIMQSHDQSGDGINGSHDKSNGDVKTATGDRDGDKSLLSNNDKLTTNGKVENCDKSENVTRECDRLKAPESVSQSVTNESDSVTETDNIHNSENIDRNGAVTCSSDTRTSDKDSVTCVTSDIDKTQTNQSVTSVTCDTNEVDKTQTNQETASEEKNEDVEDHTQIDETGEEKVEEATEELQRPTLVQMELPPNVAQLRESGNNLFRSGQYAEAIAKYTSAINVLEKESEQVVNLSLLHSNRAACQLKVGNCPACIDDCGRALELVPHSIKPLLRRGSAYETLERYRKAYIDYKYVLLIDSSVEMAIAGSARCQTALTQQDGVRWREKLSPLKTFSQWEVPVIVDSFGKPITSAAPTPVNPNNSASPVTQSSSPMVTESTTVETAAPVPQKQPELTKDEKFENAKSEGNKCVQKGDFVKAIDWYTECVNLIPDKTVSYTNRALCYLRRDQPTNAEEDCSTALALETDNIKALFRRSQSRKMLKRYKESLEDLTHLLKVDPKNAAAKKEMELVKKYYREELQKMKDQLGSTKSEKPKSGGDKKQRKRMVIQETESDEEEDDKSEVKIPESAKSKSPEVASTGKGKSGKKTATGSTKKETKGETKQQKKIVVEEIDSQKEEKVSEKSKMTTKSSKKSSPTKHITPTSVGLPVAPPSVPKLDKATPYEFITAWNSLKKAKDVQPYAELLRQIPPKDLPKMISNKLDGPMLTTITKCLEDKFSASDDLDLAYSILTNLYKVERFQTISMFQSKSEKSVIENIITRLQDRKSEIYNQTDINSLKKQYSIR